MNLKNYLCLCIIIFCATEISAKTFYLDSILAQNCIGNYSVLNRNNSGSDGDAYNNIQEAMDALNGGDTLIIRAGTYSRTGFDPRTPHEIGALDIGWGDVCNGTPDEHTVVMSYPGELPVILAEPGKNDYNSDPEDTTYANSAWYYSNPAIGIHGEYIDVIGLKTYGQVTITYANNILLESCDLGGGGPRNNQGNVIALDYDSYDITIRNNKIHNSCWGEHNWNGAAIILYEASAIIYNNEFYDNWGADIYVKGTLNQQGRTVSIRHNFLGPSSIHSNCNGILGLNQSFDIDEIYIHHNIFYEKQDGIIWGTVDDTNVTATAYNNTFINNNVDMYGGVNQRIISYNNLLYHTNSDGKYYVGYDIEAMDYNLFYSSTGQTVWDLPNIGFYISSLSDLQSHTNFDLNSVYEDPLFVNPGGNRPEDFRRQDYSGDVTGSPYSTVCGAYETGNEIIGLLSDDNMPLGINTMKSNQQMEVQQNFPNPFSSSTEIALYIPSEIKNVYLHIYDIQGYLVKIIEINKRGYFNEIIESSGIDSGVYQYTLIADNKITVSKRMVVLK